MKRVVTIISMFCCIAVFFCGCNSINLEGYMAEFESKLENEANQVPLQTEQQEEMSLPDLAEYVQARTVTITVETSNDTQSTGSGFFVDSNGTLVTSYHVIDAADSISVEISDGAKYDVEEIVDFSEMLDIAVLKIDVAGNAYLDICKETIRAGESAYAVGSSLGFLNGTFSDGIISNVSRKVGAIECVQTTAAISSGNSGGPLVNSKGQVIGINAFSYSGGENLNLAVKMSMMDELTMDKNWTISQYREWYKKEIDRSYKYWSYSAYTFTESKVNTYQYVTGRSCAASDLGWGFLDGEYDTMTEGYVDMYGVYFYEYDANEFDTYTNYLNSVGFVYKESSDYTMGILYTYENEFSGLCMDIFIVTGDRIIVVEPYSN